MPTVDGSRNLLAAGANYNAGDWASVGAEGGLDLLATANLNRGVDIGVGIEALARIDGTLRQFLAADVNGKAHAAASVRAQVQIPLDLFDEAGFAVRLQAIAEASVGVQLGIGLSIGDFLRLAENDERLRGAPFELLKIFLDELSIQGGVMAKASAAAMAYANLAATGTLIAKAGRQAGFTIAAEAGVGLKAGAGFKVFARFGVDDPRRLVRRSIDVAVDETLRAISDQLPDREKKLVGEAATPMKIGLRAVFELGTALAENGGAFSPSDRGKLALRVAQVNLEELQRLVLERGVSFAAGQLTLALQSLPYNDALWTNAHPQRLALSARLQALPEEPFDATNANRSYWLGLVTDTINLAAALSPNTRLPAELTKTLSLVWCAAQLLMQTVERVSTAGARASMLGASPVGTSVAFQGNLPDAPDAVRSHVNTALGRSLTAALSQGEAATFVIRTIGDQFEDIAPDAARVIRMLTGNTLVPISDVVSLVLGNLGAFAQGSDGRVDAEASLGVLRDGLRQFISDRIDAQILPLVTRESGIPPELRVYLDEVLLGTLRSVTGTVFDTVIDWQSGNGPTHKALRELCSSLLMRLFGRSLVVTGDVLLAHSLSAVKQELRRVAAAANNPGGIVPTLAGITGFDRELVADLVEETLDVCADTFTPMTAERRARMRDLLYQMIDTMPPTVNASDLESLKAAGMVGNAEAAFELAQLLGEEIVGNITRFIQGLLTRIAAALLEQLTDAIEDIQNAVEEWIRDIEGIAHDLMLQIADLLREISLLQQRLDDAADAWFTQVTNLLGGFVRQGANRNLLRQRIASNVTNRALDALSAVPGYGHLPAGTRVGIRRTVRSLVDDALDNAIFDPVVDALIAVSSETADLLDDLKAIEPGDDLAVAIADIVLDRIEDALRAAFNGDPSLRIRFFVPVLGNVDLGTIRIPMGTFVSVARGAIRELGNFDASITGAADALARLFVAESELAAKEDEHAAADAVKQEADQRVAEIRATGQDVLIAQPQSGSVVTGNVKLKLRIPGGNPTLLNNEGLSHRRLFVWVNGTELDLSDASVQMESNPGGGTKAPEVPTAPTTPGISRPSIDLRDAATVVSRSRLEQRDHLRKASQPTTSITGSALVQAQRFSATGTAQRFAGAILPQPLATREFPPRVSRLPELAAAALGPLGRPVLVVTLDVPASLVHEGINAIACTLVPGSAHKRIERASSFLHTRAATVKPGKPTKPPGRIRTDLPPLLETVLRDRGLLKPMPPQKLGALAEVRGNTWSLPKAVQLKAVAASREEIRKEIAAVAQGISMAREAIKAGRLAPRLNPEENESHFKGDLK